MSDMAVRAKELRYAVDLTGAGELVEEHGVALDAPTEWSPEHLLLAALVRCSLKSLEYHARRARNEVESAHGSARALITKRESDGRYATSEIDVELEIRFRQEVGERELADLLEKAERDCFVGASLATKPAYRWSVL
jgi:uncharacterized OsmC-like protein